MKNISIAFIIVFIIIVSCEDRIDFISHSLVHGELLYKDIITGTDKPVPVGASVNVKYRKEAGGDESIAPNSTFITSESGKYKFNPQVNGEYTLSFTFNDTIQQYRAELVETVDLDTTKTDVSKVISYSGEVPSVKVEDDNEFHKEDLVLQASETSLKLVVTDEDENPLSGVRVCLYESKTYADKNSPYCGGSIAYLSSNEMGEVFFTGLKEKVYYYNARGNIGVVNINNQWSEQMKVSKALTKGETTTEKIVLK